MSCQKVEETSSTSDCSIFAFVQMLGQLPIMNMGLILVFLLCLPDYFSLASLIDTCMCVVGVWSLVLFPFFC